MAASSAPCCIILLFTIVAIAECGSVGINYGRVANNLPTPSRVVQLLRSEGVERVKLYDSDSSVLAALADSNIAVVIAMPNEVLGRAAGSRTFTDSWIQSNVAQYYPRTKIEAIAVGNEVFVDPNNTTEFLVLAMKNVHLSLVKVGLDSAIKISSPIALSALQNSYPPSSGSFKREIADSVMRPMLDFLRETESALMVNAYPFFAYAANADKISLDYALFNDNAGVTDAVNGLKYDSLFDAQLDAVYSAMKTLGYDDIRIIVSETGWPSKGDENEVGAGEDNAAAYNGNLVNRVLTGKGTPLKPEEELEVYLFALFNENEKPGPTSERNYGLFYPNEEKVYDVSFGGGNKAPRNGSKSQNPPSGQSWCVASENAGEEKLQSGLDYACGEGGADCRPIQEGATCYDPNTLVAHASFAFNSYYQKNARGTGTCDFGGAAYVVTQSPRMGKCEFPTKY
uniref:glucan endo-1,3-beta-D-glucosidase n=1 Tax=Kalanchoe fedtschenkoi TaxID=63787 RepID=A0A7N0ZX98_KALFE